MRENINDKGLAHGSRIGHLSKMPFKLFTPTGSNRPYRYDRTVIPSIPAGERIYNNRSEMTPRKMDGYVTGDSNYYNDLLKHYERIPNKYWNNIGVYFFGRKAADKYGDTVIPISTSKYNQPSAMVGKGKGKGNKIGPYKSPSYITMPDRISRFSLVKGTSNPHATMVGKPGAVYSNDAVDLTDTTHKSLMGSALGHEFNHMADMYGGSYRKDGAYIISSKDSALTPAFSEAWKSRLPTDKSMLFDVTNRLPIVGDFTKAYSAPDDKNRFTITQMQRLDPYDMDDLEVRQAMRSYNRNRYALANNIRKNFNHYYLRYGFNPLKLAMVTSQPKFYSPNFAGRQQFIQDMEFYRNNPEIAELLGNEGRRGVSTYHNIQSERSRLNKQDSNLNNAYNRLVGYRVL